MACCSPRLRCTSGPGLELRRWLKRLGNAVCLPPTMSFSFLNSCSSAFESWAKNGGFLSNNASRLAPPCCWDGGGGASMYSDIRDFPCSLAWGGGFAGGRGMIDIGDTGLGRRGVLGGRRAGALGGRPRGGDTVGKCWSNPEGLQKCQGGISQRNDGGVGRIAAICLL